MRNATFPLWWFAAASAFLSALIGCQSSPTTPTVGGDPYVGPDITLDSSGRVHVAAVLAPSPGWTITLDRTTEGFGRSRLFLTLRQPSPGLAYPAVMVTQRVAAEVRTTEPVDLFARVVEFTDTESEAPYLPVLSTPSPRTRP